MKYKFIVLVRLYFSLIIENLLLKLVLLNTLDFKGLVLKKCKIAH